MGWLDLLLRPFRSAPAAAPPAEDPERAFGLAATPAPAPAASPPPRPAAPAAAAPKPPKPPKARRETPKKARKAAAVAPAAPPAAEVLTVEEAERRYRALLDAEAARAAAPPPAPDDAPAAPEPPPVPRAPRRPVDRRRAAAVEFERLLSRVDALLAVEAAAPAHLASARRGLARDWERLGPPDDDDAARLLSARDARLAALDDRLRAATAAEQAAQAAHLAAREAIVAEARALVERPDPKGVGPELGRLRARLRGAGAVSAEDARRLDAAFAEAEARFAARRDDRRQQQEAARAAALGALDRLVTQAEALARAADPEAAAERVKGLQAEWKGVKVPGPRTEADPRWTRFRAACDAVFARRTEARAASAAAAVARLEAIVAQVEALAAADDLPPDPDEVIRRTLQDWKRVGRAPREAQDALWARLQRGFDGLRAPAAALQGPAPEALQHRPFAALRPDDG